jgi:hypothetical protein
LQFASQAPFAWLQVSWACADVGDIPAKAMANTKIPKMRFIALLQLR